MNYTLADGLCSPDGQPFSIEMKLLPGFSFNYSLRMLQLIKLTCKKNVYEKMQQNEKEVGLLTKVRDGSSLPLSILLARTLVSAGTSAEFWRLWIVMTIDRSLAVGNGAVIDVGTVLEISF